MAAEQLGSLEHRSILVLGAGDMGEGMVRALVANGVADVHIANRTWERAEDLAERLAGRAVRLAELNDVLARVDLLLTGTGASSLMLEHGDFARVMAARHGRPLLVVDVAVPRDVDPSAAEVEGVTLLDMDDLRRFAEQGLSARQAEVGTVRALVDDEVERHLALASARQVAPLVGSLHRRGDDVVAAELERFRSRLTGLDDRQLEAVEALARGVVGKLLHGPTVQLKDAAGTPRGERLADALRDLFDL